jgi:hypothetical protein
VCGWGVLVVGCEGPGMSVDLGVAVGVCVLTACVCVCACVCGREFLQLWYHP